MAHKQKYCLNIRLREQGNPEGIHVPFSRKFYRS